MPEPTDQAPEQHSPTQAERVTALLAEAKAARFTYEATRSRVATGNLTRGHGGGH
ncbi:hypothetical protein ACGFY9_13995 [Streptomyces sp. NPDC048504]|uniref:hypothetical protein n=1 Tax=Streptomyces sp. NPDC048504 TaxID=3365559 RepID=UPI0037222983